MRDSTARRSLAAVAVVCIALLGLVAAPAAAQSIGGSVPHGNGAAADSGVAADGDVVVEQNETIDGDLTATAGNVVVRGTVDGDVEAAAGSVVVAGEVTGSVDAAAGSVTVEGRVGESVDAAAGSVDVVRNATVGGDVTAGAGTVTVDGTVEGDVRGSEDVSLGSTAQVGGDVTYGETLDRADGARVDGTVEEGDFGWSGPTTFDAPDWLPWAVDGFWAATTLLLGGALLLAVPRFSDDVAATVGDRPLRSGGTGVVALIAVPATLLVLLFSLVGIPLALAGGAAFAVALWVAWLYGAFALATQAFALTGTTNRWAALCTGVVGAELLVRLPFVGGLVRLVVVAVGLGAGALVIAQRRRGDGDDDADAGGTVPDESGAPA